MIHRLKTIPEDEDELNDLIKSQNQNEEGAFCTILFTVCFLMHFMLEFGGAGLNAGSHNSLYNVISNKFENNIINLHNLDE